MTTLDGGCHCGAITVAFETTRTPGELQVRACQCRFCRRHGARTVCDPAGRVTLRAAGDAVERYRFASQGADFWICRRCGIYIGAVIVADDGRSFATINARVLSAAPAQAALAIDYGDESPASRRARRLAAWTPAELQIS